jgi:hypothetical protein
VVERIGSTHFILREQRNAFESIKSDFSGIISTPIMLLRMSGSGVSKKRAVLNSLLSIYSRDHGVPKDFLWIQRNSVDTLSADWIKGRTG